MARTGSVRFGEDGLGLARLAGSPWAPGRNLGRVPKHDGWLHDLKIPDRSRKRIFGPD